MVQRFRFEITPKQFAAVYACSIPFLPHSSSLNTTSLCMVDIDTTKVIHHDASISTYVYEFNSTLIGAFFLGRSSMTATAHHCEMELSLLQIQPRKSTTPFSVL
jgi:hypothetical protein